MTNSELEEMLVVLRRVHREAGSQVPLEFLENVLRAEILSLGDDDAAALRRIRELVEEILSKPEVPNAAP